MGLVFFEILIQNRKQLNFIIPEILFISKILYAFITGKILIGLLRWTTKIKIIFAYPILFSIVYSTDISENIDMFDLDLRNEIDKNGLVDIQSLDSSIKVELKYSIDNNFMGEDVYGNLNSCFLEKKAALKLEVASKILKENHPHLSLLVVDGLRPQRVQWKMWYKVRNTPMQKYVANPKFGSMHNYGCAVDVTIVDSLGVRLDMGTEVDHFGELAEPRLEKKLLIQKKLNRTQVKNRQLLREVMKRAGFNPISIEWWHFDAFEKEYVRSNFKIIK